MTDHGRPRIGMVGDRRPASFGPWQEVSLCFVWAHYVEAVSAAGGLAVIFPPDEAVAAQPALALDGVDALVLTGGRDIDARSYGAEPHPANDEGDELRDRVELAVAGLALERDLPLLGVCRGMQILNVALGGGIEQHLSDQAEVHRGEPGAFVDHVITAAPDSSLAAILGPGEKSVRSHHHQAIHPIADGLRPAAHADDGVVEAVEATDRYFCLAVLWHPEENLAAGGAALYEALVGAARDRQGARA